MLIFRMFNIFFCKKQKNPNSKLIVFGFFEKFNIELYDLSHIRN